MVIVVIQYLSSRSDGDHGDAGFEWTLIAIGFIYAIVLRAFGFFWLRRSRKQAGYWCCMLATPEEEGTISRAVSGKTIPSISITQTLHRMTMSLPVKEFFESVL
jgi:hypothetical protein